MYVYVCEYISRNKHNGYLCEEEKEKKMGKKYSATFEPSVEDWVCREIELRIARSIAALIAALASTTTTAFQNSTGPISERRRTHGEPNRFTELTIHVPHQRLDLAIAPTRS